MGLAKVSDCLQHTVKAEYRSREFSLCLCFLLPILPSFSQCPDVGPNMGLILVPVGLLQTKPGKRPLPGHNRERQKGSTAFMELQAAVCK